MSLPLQVDTLLDNALGPKGVLRRLQRAHPHRPRRPRERERHRGGGAGARRAGRLLGADARLARRPQRLVVQRTSPTAAAQLTLLGRHEPEGARARGDAARRSPAPARSRGLTRDGQPVTRETAHGQGHRATPCSTARPATTWPPTPPTPRAPAISAVNATADAEGHATVKWTTDEPAELARRLRPHDGARQPGHRQRPGHRPQRRAHGAQPRHHLPLPRDVDRRRGQRRDVARRRRRARHLQHSAPARWWTRALPTSRAGTQRRHLRGADARPAPTARCILQPTVGEEFDGARAPGRLGNEVRGASGGQARHRGGALIA